MFRYLKQIDFTHVRLDENTMAILSPPVRIFAQGPLPGNC
jgi:hypothetical protein